MVRLVDDLRAACKGHPAAAIQWPHRLLHDAANEIERLNAGVTDEMVQRAVEAYDGVYEGNLDIGAAHWTDNREVAIRVALEAALAPAP